MNLSFKLLIAGVMDYADLRIMYTVMLKSDILMYDNLIKNH